MINLKTMAALGIIAIVIVLAVKFMIPANVLYDRTTIPCTIAGCENQDCPAGYTMQGCHNVGTPDGYCICQRMIPCVVDSDCNAYSIQVTCDVGKVVDPYCEPNCVIGACCCYSCVDAGIPEPEAPTIGDKVWQLLTNIWNTIWCWISPSC